MNKRRFNNPGGPRKSFGRGFQRGYRKFPQRTMPNAELIGAIQATKAMNEIKLAQPEAEYAPTNKFEDFKISPQVLENIKLKGYTIPTPIQDQVMHSIIEGRDVIGIANTGTSKTAAFLIPLV